MNEQNQILTQAIKALEAALDVIKDQAWKMADLLEVSKATVTFLEMVVQSNPVSDRLLAKLKEAIKKAEGKA